ncbi:MAG: sugar kinase, partial [Acidobacteriaceae bacterium]|nr:sugar kinase [Acidobacteriaceae bacterium]
DDVSLTLGGSSAICAAGLAKLGNSVTFIGKVGCDSWGDLCVRSLTAFDVDCSSVIRDSNIKTGITVAITSPQDRALVTYLGSIAALRADDISDDILGTANHLHVAAFFLQQRLRPEIKDLLARAHSHGLSTSLDPGYDPDDAWGQDLIDALTEVDVFLPNEVELTGTTGIDDPEQALRALENGRTLTVAKLGERGCMAMKKGAAIGVPAIRVDALDTTGAGDSFNAGFLDAWLRGDDLVDAMRFASACGALSTLASGGTAGQPDAERARAVVRERYRS